MTDTKDTLAEIVKTALNHSIVQAFLIFSAGLVIVSVWKSNNYVPVSFFTLFYALINFKIEALRKHESLGRYAVGNDFWQIVLYTFISILYFVWWVTGVVIVISLDRYFEVPDLFRFLPSVKDINFWVLIINIGLTTLWFMRLFYNKHKTEKYYRNKERYGVELICKNCDFEGRVKIPTKKLVKDHPCPRCRLYELKKEIKCPHCFEIVDKK